MIIFKRNIQRDNAAAVSTRTIAIEEGVHPTWKYVVRVHTEHAAKKEGLEVGPETQNYGFMDEAEATVCAYEQVVDSEALGYRPLP